MSDQHPLWAAVDIGANSVRLLLARPQPGPTLQVVRNVDSLTALGEGVAETGRILPQSLRRTAEVVAAYVEEARQAGAAEIWCLGCDAFREARNGDKARAQIEAGAGVPLRVLSGQEEAELTFWGAILGLEDLPEPFAVVDIGGGAAKFALGSREGPERTVTLPLGARKLTEECVWHDPPTEQDCAAVRQIAREAVLGSAAAEVLRQAVTLVGSGGSMIVLRDLAQERGLEGPTVPGEMVCEILRWLAEMNVAQRRLALGHHARRAEIICAGLACIAELLQLSELPEFRVSEGGLRHGLLFLEARRRA